MLDVRSVRSNLSRSSEAPAATVAWLAIYDDVVARWVTALSLTLVPVTLSVALLLKYYSRVPGYSATIAIVSSAVGLTVGIVAYRTVSVVRRASS